MKEHVLVKTLYGNIVQYQCSKGNWRVEHLQPYKKETMEKGIIYDEIDFNRCPCADKVQLILGDDFEIKVEDGKTFVVRKKNQYPKTYEECCMVLQDACMTHKGGYKSDLMQALQKLLICRDAYWKKAGEQLGLGKPWKPEKAEIVYAIFYDFYNDVIDVNVFDLYDNIVLCFPTEEMRDAFYENFKELIEECKELL